MTQEDNKQPVPLPCSLLFLARWQARGAIVSPCLKEQTHNCRGDEQPAQERMGPPIALKGMRTTIYSSLTSHSVHYLI